MPNLLSKNATSLLSQTANGQGLLSHYNSAQEAIDKLKQCQAYRKGDAARRAELLQPLDEEREALIAILPCCTH